MPEPAVKITGPREGTTRAKILELARQGKSVSDIAREIGKTRQYVHAEMRFLKMANMLDPGLARPASSTVRERRAFESENTLHLARTKPVQAEDVHFKKVTCPKCRTEFPVVV